MKKINIPIEFDVKKLDATRMYLGKKSITLEDEVTKHIEKLYEKYVPVSVREYIDETKSAISKKPKKRINTPPVQPMDKTHDG